MVVLFQPLTKRSAAGRPTLVLDRARHQRCLRFLFLLRLRPCIGHEGLEGRRTVAVRQPHYLETFSSTSAQATIGRSRKLDFSWPRHWT